jgi:hypothetical protein
MSNPVLTGSARTIENIKRDMRNVATIDRYVDKASAKEMQAMMAKAEFRRAFGLWQEAAR